jgi:lysophospholipase L1-like esterase
MSNITIRLLSPATLSGINYNINDLVNIDSGLASSMVSAKTATAGADEIYKAALMGEIVRYPDTEAKNAESYAPIILTAKVPNTSNIPNNFNGVAQVGTKLYVNNGAISTKCIGDVDGLVHVNLARNISRAFRIAQGAANVQESHIAALEQALSPLLASSAWPKIRELWVPLGANLTGALTKIKYPVGNSATMVNLGVGGINPFVAGDYDPYVGLTGNGTTKFLSTDANPTTLGMTAGNIGLAAHTTSLTWTGILASSWVLLYTGADFTVGGGYIDNAGQSSLRRVTFNTGMNFVNAIAGGLVTCGANGVTLGSAPNVQIRPNAVIQIGAMNSTSVSNAIMSGYALFDGMIEAELILLSNFFQQLNSAIGRGVFTSLVGIGDSILSNPGDTVNRYTKKLSDTLGLIEVNAGVSGSTMSLCPRLGVFGGDNGGTKADLVFSTDGSALPTGDLSKAFLGSGALYLIGYGMNDASYSGNVIQFNTAYRRSLELLKNAGVDLSTVLIVGITYASNIGGSVNTGGYYQDSIQSFLAIEAKIASDYGCMYTRCYDLWNSANAATYLLPDGATGGIHPNSAGHQLMYSAILATVQATYPRYKLGFAML